MNEFEFRFVNSTDVTDILGLFFKAYGGRVMSEAYYRWQFLENPVLPISSVVAVQDGRIMAHIGYTARRAKINGCDGILFVKQTSMSHTDVRDSGTYSRLLDWANDQLASRGGELLLSYPNVANHPIQILHPDYYDIYQIPALVRKPQTSASALAIPRDLPRGCGVSATQYVFGDKVDELGKATLRHCRFGLLRSAQYMSWRYGRRPDVDYSICELRKAGHLQSLLVWKYYPHENPDRIMIVDWLADPEDAEATKLFEAVEMHADATGLAVYTWQNIHQRVQHKMLERRGYILSEPIIYFGAFPLIDPIRIAGFEHYKNWHVAMGDVDIF